jgi:tetratricopeptide (TPR) repeat protein
MTATTHASPLLSGVALDTFLDETEEAANLQEQAGVAADLHQSALLAALRRRPCRADNMGTVVRLFRLWLRAGDAASARRVVEHDGFHVLAGLPREEQAAARISLAFWLIEVMLEGTDKPGLQQALAQAEKLLRESPAQQSTDNAWAHLAHQAAEAGDRACERRCAAERHARHTALAERAAFRAWDDALLAVRLGESFAAEGRADEARAHARQAIAALAEASPDQDVDTDDWFRLGDALIALAPDSIDDITRHVMARVPADMAPALQHAVRVQLARLQARALWALGRHAEALERAPQGRFDLSGDDDDSFSAQVLDWLMSAGRAGEAAQLAFESVFHERPVSSQRGCELAAQQAAASADVQWTLALAFAATCEAMQWVCGDESPAAFFERQLARAAVLAPGHPAIDLLRAQRLLADGDDHHAALPLLESAVPRVPGLANSSIVESLWLCRMWVHGVEKALDLPFVDGRCGGWCYTLGVRLEDLHEQLPEGTEWPEARIDELRQRYYEQGLAYFEACFAGGTGLYRDGNAHTYSMLCNNLGIRYRYGLKNSGPAIELHRKGIAASPFAEHYDGLMWCHHDLGDNAAFVDTADQLWHFAMNHGYSRHSPTGYITYVSEALYKLDRDSELAIWLQRLEEWWNGLEAEERAEAAGEYRHVMVFLLSDMSSTQPQDALARIEPVLPQLRADGLPNPLMNAALCIERAGQIAQAQALYREALALCDPFHPDFGTARERAQHGIDRCGEALRATRPWWRFWG